MTTKTSVFIKGNINQLNISREHDRISHVLIYENIKTHNNNEYEYFIHFDGILEDRYNKIGSASIEIYFTADKTKKIGYISKNDTNELTNASDYFITIFEDISKFNMYETLLYNKNTNIVAFGYLYGDKNGSIENYSIIKNYPKINNTTIENEISNTDYSTNSILIGIRKDLFVFLVIQIVTILAIIIF